MKCGWCGRSDMHVTTFDGKNYVCPPPPAYNPKPIISPREYKKDSLLELITAFIEVRNSFAALKMNMEYLSEQMEEFKIILDDVEFG